MGFAGRWCAALSLAATSMLMSASPVGAIAGYGDVGGDTYYTEAVQWSVDNDIAGISGACFSPDALVSRGETAFWIWNMEGSPQARAQHPFTDVTINAHNAAISCMAETGITTGTSRTTFSPESTLTRAEIAAFLYRLAGRPEASAHPFVDVSVGWQQGPVSWMANSGVTTGTSPTTFSPESTLTRAQLVTFLYRYRMSPDVTVNPETPTCDPNDPQDGKL